MAYHQPTGARTVRRPTRKQQIERLLSHRHQLTMRQVAHALDLVPSSHVMSILWELVDEDKLLAQPESWRPGWVRWLFQLKP